MKCLIFKEKYKSAPELEIQSNNKNPDLEGKCIELQNFPKFRVGKYFFFLLN
jgi:hypothetical protein